MSGLTKQALSLLESNLDIEVEINTSRPSASQSPGPFRIGIYRPARLQLLSCVKCAHERGVLLMSIAYLTMAPRGWAQRTLPWPRVPFQAWGGLPRIWQCRLKNFTEGGPFLFRVSLQYGRGRPFFCKKLPSLRATKMVGGRHGGYFKLQPI